LPTEVEREAARDRIPNRIAERPRKAESEARKRQWVTVTKVVELHASNSAGSAATRVPNGRALRSIVRGTGIAQNPKMDYVSTFRAMHLAHCEACVVAGIAPPTPEAWVLIADLIGPDTLRDGKPHQIGLRSACEVLVIKTAFDATS